ncbi:MAG: multicopper oxidase domain-containing protein [Burkholderiales bacterium]|uniref:multicopper oxidase domain-containing protein n=1 Tax=Nitrosomonas sp. TaxID=42353 RepID=UPI001D2BFC84|nr:multicopper oxidase domain-containing protein [Nitrosomonas sp.]MCB1949556.1 multicopper oxidase domain-containing protein [Nitrosomonas sp.]MCP5242599.1 multicopper oxidase domain-containing protein [Burkholderiales bacterium]
MFKQIISSLIAIIIGYGLFSQPIWAKSQDRVYWIAADEVQWDYAPSFPVDPMSGAEFTEDQRVFVEQGIGRLYLKSVYQEYTEGFSTVKQRAPSETHLGILGPVIRAEVGDKIIVHFKNNTRFPASIHPHGVRYAKVHEGAPDKGQSSGVVAPGETHTYQWDVPERAGPGPNDPSSIVWLYHSHADTTVDTNSGLVGPIVIARKGFMRLADAMPPKDVNREFFSLFAVFDENVSAHLNTNLSACSGICDVDDETFQESNLMHGINGLVYSNNRNYVMQKGDKVRWYIMALGTEVDLHTPHWHGATLLHNGNRLDVIEVLPAATKTLDMQPDVEGNWMYHCHVNDHLDAGMTTMFTVE